MIGGELGVGNIDKIELKRWKYSHFNSITSELHLTTNEGARLILVFDTNIEEILRNALDNVREV